MTNTIELLQTMGMVMIFMIYVVATAYFWMHVSREEIWGFIVWVLTAMCLPLLAIAVSKDMGWI